MAQFTASTALANITSIPSPVVLISAAFVPGDRGVHDLAPQSLQGCQRADLIGSHQPGVPGNICCQDRRQPSLDTPLGHRISLQ
jgi:hypothetical protein